MTKPLLLTLFALFLTQSVVSQDCPVRITHVLHDRDVAWNYSFLTLSFTNASGKRLADTSFGAVAVDSLGERHALMAELRSGKKVRPGDSVSHQRLGPLGREVIDPHTRVKLRTWVQTV